MHGRLPLVASTLLLLLLLAPGVVHAATTIVDLSREWEKDPDLYNQNKAYCDIQAELSPLTSIGYVVLQDGVLLAEGYVDGYDQDGQYDAWSSTKSWSTMLVGVLVDQGKLAVEETLGDIFSSEKDWTDVDQADEKKKVTLEEILTMTSGLVTACSAEGEDPQTTLQEVLNLVDFEANEKGEWNYLAFSHIVARIIQKRAGMTLQELATSAGIFAGLGITDDDLSWYTTGGLEGSAFGIQTSPRIQAKLGQLYLQRGKSSSTNQLLSESWVEESTRNQLKGNRRNGLVSLLKGYGYQWFTARDGDDDDDGNYAEAFAAAGACGQLIMVLPSSNTVISIMSQNCLDSDIPFVSTGYALDAFYLLNTIVDHLDDIKVESSTNDCDTFSYLDRYIGNFDYFLREFVQATPSVVVGSVQEFIRCLSCRDKQ